MTAMIQLFTDNYVWITVTIAILAAVAFVVCFLCRLDHRAGSKNRAIMAMWSLRWLAVSAMSPLWPLALPIAVLYGVWSAVKICRAEIKGEVAA